MLRAACLVCLLALYPGHTEAVPGAGSAAAAPVHTVHLVFSHHLDVGLNEGLGLVEFCTGFATKVIQEYFDDFIPRAIALAAEVNSGLEPGPYSTPSVPATTAPDGRFAYTIHPWIASLYVDCVGWDVADGCKLNPGKLRCPSKAESASFDAAVRRGDILWADSPMNLNAGVVGEPSMFEGMLDIAGALNERYNLTKPARVWNNVDVPGFARSSIPALLRGGATALSVLANVGSHYPCNSAVGHGCNDAVPVEFVGDQNATMFRWHDPASDEEILVLYHKAQWDTPADVPLYMFGTTYGGFTRPDNMIVAPAGGVALASFIAGDNTGPPSAAEVRKVFKIVRSVFPHASTVVGSTWDRFVAEISAEEVASLPRYSSEWGDKWVSGMVNDPGRLATYRALVRGRAGCMAAGACTLRDPVMRNFTRFVSKNTEHTQGVQGDGMQPGSQWCAWVQNIGITCPGDADWTNRAFRANHNALTNRFPGADDSWLESRLFNQLAIQAVPPAHPLAPFLRRELDALLPRHPARQQLPPAVSPGESAIEDPRKVDCTGTVLEFSATTGALDRLTFRGADEPWAQLMDLRYLTYRDATKKGMVCNQSDCPNPIAGAWAPTLRRIQSTVQAPETCHVVLDLAFNETLHQEYGAPSDVTAVYTIDPVHKRVDVSLTWRNKSSTRLLEAMTVFNRPVARAGHRWEVDNVGEWTSPANVTVGGNLYQHALWTGVRYTTDEDGDGVSPAPPQGLWISSLDAAMACPVLNKLADSALTPESSLLQSCFDYHLPSRADTGTPPPLTDSMIDGMGISMFANRFTISGFPQWYPFGVPGVNYQVQDETMQFRFALEER